MDHIWRDVKGYEGLYMISNLGFVKSVGRLVSTEIKSVYVKERLLKSSLNTNKYLKVHLSHNGSTRTFLLHRIIAEAFIDNPLNLPMVNHIDGNKQNNNVFNLEWCTGKQNAQHASKMRLLAFGESNGASRLKQSDIQEIKRLYSLGTPMLHIARAYGVSDYAIRGVVNNKTWKQ